MKKLINMFDKQFCYVIIGIFIHVFLGSCQNIPMQSQEIYIDTFYVDYANKITLQIHNFKDTEECVKKVFNYYEEIKSDKIITFITDKGALHIEHNQVYIDRKKTNRFSFLKCDSLPYSIQHLNIALLKKNNTIPLEIVTGEENTYFKGDFENMSFAILKSFNEAIIFGKFEKKKYHTYILVNKYGEPKFEFSSYNPHRETCRTYKIH